MRLIKTFLVGLLGLAIVITLFSLLIPSQVRVSRAVVINNTTPAAVLEQLSNFDRWKHWHPIFTADSAQLKVAPAVNSGKTAATILQRGKEIHLQLTGADTSAVRFILEASGENSVNNEIVISQASSSETIQVEWRAITQLPWYPWQKFYGIFIDQLTGPGYEAALNGLKSYLEAGTPGNEPLPPPALPDSTQR